MRQRDRMKETETLPLNVETLSLFTMTSVSQGTGG